MASLLDYGPPTERVKLGGGEIDVTGCSAHGMLNLFVRFPPLAVMMRGGSMEIDAIFMVGGDAVNAIIAAGCGFPGNEQAETRAGLIAAHEQRDLVKAILRRTMPEGLGPFLASLEELMPKTVTVEAAEPQARGDGIPVPSGMVRVTKSPKPSTSLSA